MTKLQDDVVLDDEPGCGEEDDGPEIEARTDGSFACSLLVPADYRTSIIGKGGAVKKAFEAETGASIHIPERGKDGLVVVKAASAAAVRSARNRILLKLRQARRSKPFTHFLSLPLNVPAVQRPFVAFQDACLCLQPPPLAPELFQPAAKLHLTLAMLTIAGQVSDNKRAQPKFRIEGFMVEIIISLRDRELDSHCIQFEEELKQVKACLESAVAAASASIASVTPGQLRLSLRGLEIMNDDPSAVDVLYAKVADPDGILERFCGTLRAELRACEQAEKDEKPLKLHATLANSKYSESAGRATFDAREVLRRHGDFDLGNFVLSTVHLSQRAGAPASSYYTASHVVDVFQM